jgi:hypothetical protein
MPHAAASLSGRPLQGDALYVRDFGLKIPESDAEQVSDEKLAKTAAIFAMFDLPAEAVEHVQRFRTRLSRLLDVDQVIEGLTQEAQAQEVTAWRYAEYMAAFDAQDPYFFNRQLAPAYDPNTRTGAHPTTLAQAVAREALAHAKAAEAEAARLRVELEALRASKSWKLTAPLRRLRRG